MMNIVAAAGIRDAIFSGVAKLEAPLTPYRLSMLRCGDRGKCEQGSCPMCAARSVESLHKLYFEETTHELKWQRSVYALADYTFALDDLRPMPITQIRSLVGRILDAMRPSEVSNPIGEGINCAAVFGLVQNKSSSNTGEKIVLVEFAYIGFEEYDLYETLQYKCGVDTTLPFEGPLPAELVPLVSAPGLGLFPDSSLLFGYSGRRIDVAEGPLPVVCEVQLASMACNYGEHSIADRLLARGPISKVVDLARGDLFAGL